MRPQFPPIMFKPEPIIPIFEVISILVLIAVSFYIYIKTKELYELSGHKGIDYFRKAFFFFGISGILQLIQICIRHLVELGIIDFYFKHFFMINMVFSLIAIVYLVFSIFSNYLKREYLIYLIAPIMIIIPILFREREAIFVIHTILFLTILIGTYIGYTKKKHKKFISKIYIIYLLIFTFWMLNMLRFQIEFMFKYSQEIISIINSIIFAYIYFVFRKRFLEKEDS